MSSHYHLLLYRKTHSKIKFIALYWQNWENWEYWSREQLPVLRNGENVESFLVNHHSLHNALAHYTHKCKKMQLSSIRTITFFHNIFSMDNNNFYNNFLRKIFAVLCLVCKGLKIKKRNYWEKCIATHSLKCNKLLDYIHWHIGLHQFLHDQNLDKYN